ncbi:HAD hydrolase-like protein [Allosaccharopolyspora coralli]|uniref:HAD hydrolase-like protein n=1 Tax=Allosaccharopolyspora coralli TaxID=2665642 RepID=A0A5Q3QD81_9PSEU|nr:HAD hydrolase-like protein [Allosaccharopolyspora coralli]QGK69445.1 HAD hydrolase-like protein [Allosaccharopolyspora coralli]
MSAQSEPSQVQHIVWDWNGTILDDNDAVVAAVNVVCEAFGRAPVDLDTWRATYSRPLRHCYERLLDRDLDEDDWARVDRLYHEAYRDLLPSCALATGVPEALDSWRGPHAVPVVTSEGGQPPATGRSQSLLSMWFHDELVPLVSEYGLDRLFARVDGLRSEIGGGSKAVHLDKHLGELGVDPGETVLIGDVLDDAHAAEHVGARCILLTTGVMNRSALETSGFPVVDSVPEALARIHDEPA